MFHHISGVVCYLSKSYCNIILQSRCIIFYSIANARETFRGVLRLITHLYTQMSLYTTERNIPTYICETSWHIKSALWESGIHMGCYIMRGWFIFQNSVWQQAIQHKPFIRSEKVFILRAKTTLTNWYSQAIPCHWLCVFFCTSLSLHLDALLLHRKEIVSTNNKKHIWFKMFICSNPISFIFIMCLIMVVISAQHVLICVRLTIPNVSVCTCAPFAASFFPPSVSRPAVHLF